MLDMLLRPRLLRLVYLWILLLAASLATSQAAESDVVSVAVFMDHDAYVESSAPYGVAWRLLQLSAKNRGLRLQSQEISWGGAVERLKAHKVDIALGALRTKRRSLWAGFSLPLGHDYSALFTRADNPVLTLESIDIENSTVGVAAKSVQEQVARRLGFKHVYSTNDQFRLYTMLVKGRIDYLFYGQNVVKYFCRNVAQTQTENCLKQVGQPLHESYTFAITAKSNPRGQNILNSLNEGIIAIRDNAEAIEAFREFGLSDNDYQEWSTAISDHVGN